MISRDRTDLGTDVGTFDDGEEITLDAFFARILPGRAVGGDGDLVDLVNKDDPPLLHFADRQIFEFLFIEEVFARFVCENFFGLFDSDLFFLPFFVDPADHFDDRLLDIGHLRGHVASGKFDGGSGQIDFDHEMVKLSPGKLLLHPGKGSIVIGLFLFAGTFGQWREKFFDNFVFDVRFDLLLIFFILFFAHQLERGHR